MSQLRSDTQDFETRSQSASADIEKQRADALAQIDAALKPLKGFLTESQTIQLSETFSPSVYSVATLDEQGKPSVGHRLLGGHRRRPERCCSPPTPPCGPPR